MAERQKQRIEGREKQDSKDGQDQEREGRSLVGVPGVSSSCAPSYRGSRIGYYRRKTYSLSITGNANFCSLEGDGSCEKNGTQFGGIRGKAAAASEGQPCRCAWMSPLRSPHQLYTQFQSRAHHNVNLNHVFWFTR